MRTLSISREKPRPLPEPLAAAAATNAENPSIDAVDELAVGGQTAAEAGDVGSGVGGRGSGVEDRGEGAGGWNQNPWSTAVSMRRLAVKPEWPTATPARTISVGNAVHYTTTLFRLHVASVGSHKGPPGQSPSGYVHS